MSQSTAIAERAVGAFPLSVATSLAIEAACGVHPEHPATSAPVLQYDELWINLRTLYRNFMGSLTAAGAAAILPPYIASTVSQEMETINGIIQDHAQSRVKIVYYYSNYAFSPNQFKVGVLRADNTPRQKEYTALSNATMKILLKEHEKTVVLFETKLNLRHRGSDAVHRPKILLLTHYAYDLLSYQAFKEVVLLESHTGAIKERAQWYTKYYNGKDLAMIPFREDFIQVFGDHETFRPADIKLRKELIEVATKYKWSAVSTHDKLVYGIDQIQNPFSKALLKSILV